MSVIEFIILSFALSVPVMVTLRGCALQNPIRLTRGLGNSFLVSIIHVLLMVAGLYIGNLLRFGFPEYDNLVYLGFMVVVALRMFFPAFRKKEKPLPAYDISRWSVAVSLFVVMFLLCYLGIMLGRTKKDLGARRWQLIAVLFLLIFAIKGAFFTN